MSFGAGFQRSTHTAFGVMGWTNPLDFGVRGDGVTDDGVFLIRLFEMLVTEFGGGVVLLSPTVNGYRFDEAVSVPAGVTVLRSPGVDFTAAELDTSGGGVVWDMREPSGTPPGGTAGQVLTRTSATESGWQDPAVTLAMFDALAARVTVLEGTVGT